MSIRGSPLDLVCLAFCSQVNKENGSLALFFRFILERKTIKFGASGVILVKNGTRTD